MFKQGLIVLFLVACMSLVISTEYKQLYDVDTKDEDPCAMNQSIPRNATSFSLGARTLKENLNCHWEILLDETHSQGIVLILREFQLKEDDTMKLYNLTNSSKPEELFPDQKFKGYKDPFSILTGVEKLQINVTTSSAKGERRIDIFGTRTPVSVRKPLTVTSGSITSPIYKTASSSTMFNMTLKLKPLLPDTKLAFSFSNFTIDKGAGSLRVTHADTVHETETFSGNELPPDLIGGGATDFLLTIDLSIPNQTFTLVYDTVASCSSRIGLTSSKPEATLDSPKKKDLSVSSANGIKCVWLISGDDSSKKIGIDLQKLKLSSPLDVFDIREGQRRASPGIAFITSSNLEESKSLYVRSAGNNVVVSFTTYLMDLDATFSLSVAQYDDGGYYKGNGNATSITVKNPNNKEVVYLFEADPNKQIFFSKPTCAASKGSKGTLDIYNNFMRNSTPVSSLSVSNQVDSIVSKGQQLMIIPKGFSASDTCSLTYQSVPEGCHFIDEGTSGTLNFVGNCNENCSWTITPKDTKQNEILILRFTYLSLKETDELEVRTFLSSQNPIAIITSNVRYLPPMYLDPSNGIYVSIKRGNCTAEEAAMSVVKATYDIQPSCDREINVRPGTTANLSSPNYPDNYPLNANCTSKLVTNETSLLRISFNKLELAYGHKLEVLDKNNTIVKKYDQDNIMLPDDLLLHSKASLLFTSTLSGPNNLTTNQGYDVSVLSADCGGAFNAEEGRIESPGYPNATKDAVVCTWIIEVPPKTKDSALNIILFNISFSNDGVPNNDEFKIYEGASFHDTVLTDARNATNLSRTNVISILYKSGVKNASEASKSFEINYTAMKCLKMCDNGICMHDDWYCNGVNDCGDWSDENGCNGTGPHPPAPTVPPTPLPSEKSKGGVSPVAVGILVPLAFVLGILATIFVPVLIRKVRSGQYREFRDMPEVA